MLAPLTAAPDVVNRGGQWGCLGTWDLATCHLFNNISPDEHVQGKQYESSEWRNRWWKKNKRRGQARKNKSEKDPLYGWGLLLEPAEKICQLKVEEGKGSSNPRLLKDVTQLTSNHTSYIGVLIPFSPLSRICLS